MSAQAKRAAKAQRIEDYALLGDCHTAALVGRDGSIDWLCLPRFDSGACFAALLGDERNGRWRIAPANGTGAARRRYRGDTLVLETEIESVGGAIRIVDFMTPGGETREVVRIVEGVRASVRVESELRPRFDYGRARPWLRRLDGGVAATAGPDGLWLRTPAESRIDGGAIRSDVIVGRGQRIPFVLSWHASHEPAPSATNPFVALEDAEAFWGQWVSACSYEGEWRNAVVRSLITLKALSYAPTGGIVAAPTASLPEELGGVRNWDYRFCWLRDAAFTLVALTSSGFRDEARAWRDWLLRAIAGDPADLQIVYGLAGERRLEEWEPSWLSG